MIRNLKKNRGSALVFVLVMVFLLAIITTAVLGSSVSGARQSAFVEDYEQLYYNAESATNVAMQLLKKEFADFFASDDIKVIVSVDVAPLNDDPTWLNLWRDSRNNAIADLRSRGYSEVLELGGQFEDYVDSKTRNVENTVTANAGGLNYQTVIASVKNTLTQMPPFDGNTDIEIEITSDAEMKNNSEILKSRVYEQLGLMVSGDMGLIQVNYQLNAYMDAENIEIITTFDRGGVKRGIEVNTGASTVFLTGNSNIGTGTSEVDDITYEFDGMGNGKAYYKPQPPLAPSAHRSDGFYTGASEENTDAVYDGLKAMMADNKSMGRNSVINDGVIASIPATNQHVSSGNYTLNSNNNTLEYLKVNGNLTISGNVSFENLKYIEVTGNITISASSVNAPALEGVFVEGKAILSNLTSGNGFQGKVDIPRTNFLIQGNGQSGTEPNDNSAFVFTLGSSTKIDNCIFNVQGGDVYLKTSGGNNTLSSNSIFIASKNATGQRGQMAVGNQRNFEFGATAQLPQFYSEGKMSLYVHNSGQEPATKYAGIFGTLSNDPMFTGGGASNTILLEGMFIGNTPNNYRVGRPASLGGAKPNAFEGGVEGNRIIEEGGLFGYMDGGSLLGGSETFVMGDIHRVFYPENPDESVELGYVLPPFYNMKILETDV